MTEKVVFHLAKAFPPLTPVRPYLHCVETLYEKIKKGKKTSEWREPSKYWLERLCLQGKSLDGKKIVRTADVIEGRLVSDLTEFLKVHRVWFLEGYPKRSLPRLEADIVRLLYHPEEMIFPAHKAQLEIQFAGVREVRAE